MGRCRHRPEQLRLELEWDYLYGLLEMNEQFDFYKVMPKRPKPKLISFMDQEPLLRELCSRV